MLDHLAESVAAISVLQWIELTLIVITLITSIIWCWKLVQQHPLLTAICGIVIALCLPLLIEQIRLTREQEQLAAVTLIVILTSVCSYLTHQR